MILEKLRVNSGWPPEDVDSFTNCYLIGSLKSRKIYIIDPGGNSEIIINRIRKLKCKPIAVVLTHTHIDHMSALTELKKEFEIQVLYSRKEFDFFKKLKKMKADKWLNENDVLNIDQINLHVLDTAGHSPGGISLYTYDFKKFDGKSYDGIIFTGDLLFKGNVGRTDIRGGDLEILYSNIKNKIMNNPKLSDNFLILEGHQDLTTIGFEKKYNPYRLFFL